MPAEGSARKLLISRDYIDGGSNSLLVIQNLSE